MGENSSLRVLFWMRDSREIPGGPRVQMQRTAEAMQHLVGHVEVSTEPEPSLRAFDVVHGFGVDASGIRRVRHAGALAALSTIYNPIAFTHGLDRPMTLGHLVRQRSRSLVGSTAAVVRGRDVQRARRVVERITRLQLAYESADLLLPNAKGELADLRSDLGVTTAACVVPNAIDEAVFCGTASPAFDTRDGVLCVGRLEPHKNQLALAEVCCELGLQLTLVGPEHPHHQGYLEVCKRAYPAMRWIPECDQEELVAHYDQARVHVLCSWFETTGLSTLEAAARGCAIVSTSRGYAAEYFGDDAVYCDPGSPRSIIAAIRESLERPPSPDLRQRIRDGYTWRATAEATIRAYERSRAG